jgi:hypothetical protein
MMLTAICSSSPVPKPLYERLLFFCFCLFRIAGGNSDAESGADQGASGANASPWLPR